MSEKMNVIKIGKIAAAEKQKDGTFAIFYDNGDKQVVDSTDFYSNWIEYNCLPVNVIPWLNSVIMQHMPLISALGGTVPEDKYDYSKLTDDVLLWLSNPDNEKTFAKSMFFGPRLKIDTNEKKYEQLSLLPDED